MDQKILSELLKLTPIEKEQLVDHRFRHDHNSRNFISGKNTNTPIFSVNIINKRDIYLAKYNRFARYPEHTHTFVEMNYLVAGVATEFVDGQEVQLQRGDILLLDVGTTHSIDALNKDDILVKLDFKSFSHEFYQDKNISPFHFYMHNIFNKSFLLFRKEQTEKSLRDLIDLIIREYYINKRYTEDILNLYVGALFHLLSRNINIKSKIANSRNDDEIILSMLKDIMDSYRSVSLNELAKKYNYNRNYLSNLFKEKVGQTFSKVLLKRRISIAYDILQTTSYSVETVMKKVGFTNPTFFYKNFKEKYHKTPSEIRKNKNDN